MKKYIIFAIRFILLFSLFQVLSGLFLTLTYAPDITDAWDSSTKLPQEVTFGKTFSLHTLIFAVFSATIAYFIPKKFIKKQQ